MTTHYIVQTAAARMPNSCWGTYRRVAVLEVEPGVKRASMISTHARGVRRVVYTWGACNVGSTERCAYARAVRAAEALIAELQERDARAYHDELVSFLR